MEQEREGISPRANIGAADTGVGGGSGKIRRCVHRCVYQAFENRRGTGSINSSYNSRNSGSYSGMICRSVQTSFSNEERFCFSQNRIFVTSKKEDLIFREHRNPMTAFSEISPILDSLHV